MHITVNTAINVALLSVYVGTVVQLAKPFISTTSPNHDAYVRLLAAAAGIAGVVAQMVLPAVLLENLVLGVTAGAAAIVGYPVVKAGATAVTSTRVTRPAAPAAPAPVIVTPTS